MSTPATMGTDGNSIHAPTRARESTQAMKPAQFQQFSPSLAEFQCPNKASCGASQETKSMSVLVPLSGVIFLKESVAVSTPLRSAAIGRRPSRSAPHVLVPKPRLFLLDLLRASRCERGVPMSVARCHHQQRSQQATPPSARVSWSVGSPSPMPLKNNCTCCAMTPWTRKKEVRLKYQINGHSQTVRSSRQKNIITCFVSLL